MIKYLILATIFLFSHSIYSNEVEVIELHENKSLDQMVLDQINDDEDSEIENSNNSDESKNLVSEIDTSDILENEAQVEIITDNFWTNNEPATISNYLENSKNLKSKVLQNELNNFLEILDLDYSEKKYREIFNIIVRYFYDIGNISKAYNLIQTRDLKDDEFISFYDTVEINYLLSTFQLEDVCSLKNTLSQNNNNLKYFLLEKLDIFCLVLVNNLSEAELLYSILMETETDIDKNFQFLFLALTEAENEIVFSEFQFEDLENNDLIFLYSAMARIAEIPLSENFLQIDPDNLAIPIILNRSSPIDLRLRAANKSFLNNNISIESLAALYQSVDFDSKQLNNPNDTIVEISNDIELLMAFYFQLVNIQIFPSERLESLIKFWDYAKIQNLERIAYSLTYKTVQSIEISSENLEYSPQIAVSYIFNKDFPKALEWIDFYKNNKDTDELSSYVEILLSLYSTNQVNSISEVIIENLDKFVALDKKNEELIYILLNTLGYEISNTLTQNFDNIYDYRLMPSIFVIHNIQEAISLNEDYKLLIFSIISLNDKEWINIHPEHLRIILNGFLNYSNEDLLTKIIIEIFENYKII